MPDTRQNAGPDAISKDASGNVAYVDFKYGFKIPRPPVNTPLYDAHMRATAAFRATENRQRQAYADLLNLEGFVNLNVEGF